MVGLRLVAGVAVAAFVPPELCPDLLVAAARLTQAGLLARDFSHRASFTACPMPDRMLAVIVPARRRRGSPA
jgi:hypothetical protein